MKQEFVPYDRALKLKQLGFDEPCFGYYKKTSLGNDSQNLVIQQTEIGFYNVILIPEHTRILAPLFSQAFRWFREEHKLFVSIEYSTRSQTDFVITINKIAVNDARDEEYKTYEVAELFALDKLIEIVEIKQRQPNISEWDGPYAF
jgi:hypothetical protein